MPQGEAPRLFGTDGIRSVAGEFPLDEKTIEVVGRSLTERLAENLGHPPRLVIGRDTRESGPWIEQSLARGAMAAGASVESAGVITTPGVAFLTRVTPFDAGVVISASHNPYADNGIKVFSPSGRKLADEMERKIERDIAASNGIPPLGGAVEVPSGKAEEFRQRYIDFLCAEIAEGLRLDGMRLGIDCANGAACGIAPEVFRRLGAEVSVLFDAPDGRNINEGCGSLHPGELQKLVVENRLDCGVAFDGDADRALLVDAAGNLVDGDQMMLILGEFMKSLGRLKGDTVVSTVMSNIGLEIALRERGIEMVRAQVGDRYVLEELLRRGASLGGEQSGHIIFTDISLAGDGLITAIEVLRAIRHSGRTFGDLASEMTRYPQVLVNVRVKSKPRLETLPEVQDEMRRLTEEMAGRGRLLVRYSGTENLARVMIEGEDQATIERQARQLADCIQKAIG